MKKLKTLFIIMLCPLFIFSQNISEEKRKKIESQKIAFITKALDLSSEEAQVFWPVYNDFSDEMKTIRKKRREVFSKARKNRSSLTEKEIGIIIDERLKMEQETLDLKVKYNKEFQKVISNKQISALYHAEEEFKKELLRRIKKGKDKDQKRKR
ncbi:MAG: hypothetical protein HN427_07830 [Flavobacteriales bacterium]|jgi:hypothetical protein|nr:hypothetical protein [Flavobacteriales bacterium]MBT6014244.1 hypothetical protein [Flavobacteriales bacterium]MBT7481677.1 hypothetical protein [Flavobacteriales bacterium]